MSVENTNVGTQVTGLEVQDAETIIAKRVNEELAKQRLNDELKSKGTFTADQIEALLAKANAPAAPAAPTVYKVPIGGQEYTFNSLEELGQQVSAALAQRQAAPAPQESPKPAGYDEAEFEKILKANDTPKAFEYVLQHTGIAQRLAAQEAQLAALRMKETARDVQQLVPGFKPDAKQLQILDNIRQQLGGDPANPYSWEAAAAVAKSRGLIPEIGASQSNQPSAPARNENTQSAAPYLGRSSAEASVGMSEKDAWGLSIESLRKIREEIASARGSN